MKKENKTNHIMYYMIFYFIIIVATIFLYEKKSDIQKTKEKLSNLLHLTEDLTNGERAKYAFFITDDILCVIFSENHSTTICFEKQDKFSYTIWYHGASIERISITNNIGEPYNTYDKNGDGIPDNMSRGYRIDLDELYTIKYDKYGKKVLEKMPRKAQSPSFIHQK